MNSLCLRDKLADLPEKDQVHRINIFQELILKRFVYNYCFYSIYKYLYF